MTKITKIGTLITIISLSFLLSLFYTSNTSVSANDYNVIKVDPTTTLNNVRNNLDLDTDKGTFDHYEINSQGSTTTLAEEDHSNDNDSFGKGHGWTTFVFHGGMITGSDVGFGVTVYYKNVGTYAGKPIDLKVYYHTMIHGDKEDSTFLKFYHNITSGFWFDGTRSIQVDFQFYYSGDNFQHKINIQDSYFNIGSLNLGEYTGITDSQVNTNRAYLSNDTMVEKSADPYTPQYTDFDGINNNFDDFIGGATYYKSAVFLEMRGTDNNFIFSSTHQQGWFSFSPTSLIPNAKLPTTDLIDDFGTSMNNNQIHSGILYNLNISQNMGVKGVDLISTYSSMKFVANLDSNSHCSGVWLEDSKGNAYNASTSGTLTQDSGHAYYDVSKDFLSNNALYDGRDLIVKFRVTPNDGVPKGTQLNFSSDVILNTVDRYAGALTANVTDNIKTKQLRFYSPTGSPLSGVRLKVISRSDDKPLHYDSLGNAIDSSNVLYNTTTLDTLTTDSNGAVSINNYYLGQYSSKDFYIKVLTVPAGYNIPVDNISYSLNINGDYDKFTLEQRELPLTGSTQLLLPLLLFLIILLWTILHRLKSSHR